MSKIRIEFCASNLETSGTLKVKQMIEQMDGVEMELLVLDCMGYCFDCSEMPYVVINEEVIQADTPEELLRKVSESLKVQINETGI